MSAYGDMSLDRMSRELLEKQRAIATRIAELRTELMALGDERRAIDADRAEAGS